MGAERTASAAQRLIDRLHRIGGRNRNNLLDRPKAATYRARATTQERDMIQISRITAIIAAVEAMAARRKLSADATMRLVALAIERHTRGASAAGAVAAARREAIAIARSAP
jgi:hypothetical protein